MALRLIPLACGLAVFAIGFSLGPHCVRADDADFPHASPGDEMPLAPEPPPPGTDILGATPPPTPEAAPAPTPNPEAAPPSTPGPAPEANGQPPSPEDLLAEPPPANPPAAEAQPPAPPQTPQASQASGPSAAPPPASAGNEANSTFLTDEDLGIPRFTRMRPQWAFQIDFSGSALGGSTFSDGPNSTILRGVDMAFEYQPAIFQSFGIVSAGLLLGYYPQIPRYTSPLPQASVLGFGAQLRYQARFFREQPIVPYVGFAYEELNYHLDIAPPAFLPLAGVIGGAEILLNVFEPSAAFDFFTNAGVLRSYLVAEVRDLYGNSSNLTISGFSYFFGLRIEF